MYQLTTLLVALVAGLRVSAATVPQTIVAWDSAYDDRSALLNSFACASAFESYHTLGSLPNFPYVGGLYPLTSDGFAPCGACFNVTYGAGSISVIIVDQTTSAFVMSKAAMDMLTWGEATAVGNVNTSFTAVASSFCHPK